jgi:dsRNA-specific ribonuclease
MLGEGEGTSRKDAERAAATAALIRLEQGGEGADEVL